MLVHLLPDDKFVHDFVVLAEQCGHAHGLQQVFLVRDVAPFSHLPNNGPYTAAPLGSAKFTEITQQLGKGDKLIIHFLSKDVRKWLATFNTEAKIGWAFWGSDFYLNMYYDFPFSEPLTQQFLEGKNTQVYSRFGWLHRYRKRKQQQIAGEAFWREAKAAAAKVDVLYHFIKADAELVNRSLDANMRWLFFFYPLSTSIADTLKIADAPIKPLSPYARHILVGNNGYPINNHVDCFEHIKHIDSDTAVVVPLSYGEPAYTAFVKEQGLKYFGDRFIALENYMPFNEYVSLLLQVDAAVMGHRTPNAMGNLHMLLYSGKRVFLKPEANSYAYFVSRGMYIDKYCDFDPKTFHLPVKPEELAINRQLMDEFDGKEAHIKYITQTLLD